MAKPDKTLLENLRSFSSATIFNAVVETMGATQGGRELEDKGGQPTCYTTHHLKYLTPEFGNIAGYAVTVEVTAIDPNSPSKPWMDYYKVLNETSGPIITFMKDIDAQKHRGASFGDNMAAVHKNLCVVGAIVEGTVRDLKGIKNVGMPIWGYGLVPGHGIFNLCNVNQTIQIADITVSPGDLAIADDEGCTIIPNNLDPYAVLNQAKTIIDRENKFQNLVKSPSFSLADWEDIAST